MSIILGLLGFWLLIIIIKHIYGVFRLNKLHSRITCSRCLNLDDFPEICPFYRVKFSRELGVSDKRLIRFLSEENLSLIKEEYSKQDLLHQLREVNTRLELKIKEALSNEN